MFVSHFFLFLIYLYVTASVQRKNRLARDKRFLAISAMPWFNRKKWFVLRHARTHHHWRRKCLPNAPHEALRLVLMRQSDGQRPPEQADIILGVLRGYMALKELNPLQIISTCSGGCCPSSKEDCAGRKALRAALGGDFCRRRLWSAIVVMVFVDR